MNSETQHMEIPYSVSTPESWPQEPADLTYSTLREIEACPRRWALSSASYPSLWTERGYPPRVHLKSLAGIVVHNVLETLTKELATAGCPSVLDPSAVRVLQRLGGLSQIVERAIEQLAIRTSLNPRAARLTEYFTRSLRAQSSELRGRVQRMLARQTLLSEANSCGNDRGRRFRGPLNSGLFPEIELRVPRMGWKGRVDLLALATDTCEITDFKTGEPSDDHSLQLRIYALLWNNDDVLNPTSRLVTKLILAYPQGDIEVSPPTLEELSALKSELTTRAVSARNSVAIHPPEARPTPDNCRFCGVRHLCDKYWNPEVQRQMINAPTGAANHFFDAEITILGRHGPKSWDIQIGSNIDQPRGLLRTSGDHRFRNGQRLRVLDVVWAKDESVSNGLQCLTMGMLSEAYVQSSDSI